LNVLLIRAGALGDVLLLRAAVAALRASGHAVSLLAPSPCGAALRGHGPSDVDSVLPWESAMFAGLLTDHANVSPDLRAALAPFHVVIAYTASVDLLQGLARATPSAELIAHSPLPPPSGPHAADWLAQAVARSEAIPPSRRRPSRRRARKKHKRVRGSSGWPRASSRSTRAADRGARTGRRIGSPR
jgi:hypothetical protein